MAYAERLVGDHGWSWVLALLSLVVSYNITRWIYNILFHPLANFPGPLLWRASRLPYMRATWGGYFPIVVHELHERYGDVVRTAPNELSFRNPAAWDDIYTGNNGAKAFTRSELWHGNPDGGPASVFITPELKAHARIRKFIDPAFSERAVLQQEPILQKYADLCVEKLGERFPTKGGSITVNVTDWLNYTLLDIIGDLSFGESFNCLQKCQYEDWMANMGGVIKLHFLSINLRYYPFITTFMKPLRGLLIPKETVKQQMDYQQRAAAKLDRRLKSKTNRPDIVSQLLRSENGGEGLTPDEVQANSMLFINAASETVATTLTGAFNNLVQDPESLSQLEREIHQFLSLSELTLQALKNLPYLNAVLKEALRMCGPTPIGNMRISPPEGGMVDGHFVAGNTMVTIPQIAVAYTKQHFHEPYAWHPERWLQDAESNPKSPFYHDRRKAVRAFGVGPYSCPGEPLAWAQMRLVMAKIIWAFEVTKTNTTHSQIAWQKQKVFAIFFKDPLDVTLNRRVA